MNSAETVSPVGTPPDFARASGTYRLRVWMAMLGLVLFVLLYIGLAGFFTFIAYRMIAGVFVGGEGAVASFFAALPAAFLAIFMWKALFFVRHGSDNPGIEITETDQPRLFLFLHELADEVGAPRPHRVFLSPVVNASVFYDLSILNFFLPSKKNLTIGLGLVNVLTRSEFRAVLAHEFGHFAQRSMAVGRWVYVGEQIAGHIIAKRDALDRTLDFLSHIDLRVAWIGWIMRTIVWSIRSLMETVFRWVVIAHRALSREMEFDADLVAVSATGSDALIDALYRLQPADEDWERTLDFANTQLGKGKMPEDLFEAQTLIGEHMRRVLNEPTHGQLPPPTAENPAERRLFTEQIAQPPKMWSTHPPNTEREENAKRVYIAAPLEAESAWTLFDSPLQVRKEVTRFLFDSVKLETRPESMTAEDVRTALDEQFSHESYDTRYRGAYLGRRLAIGARSVDEMYDRPPGRAELPQSLRELYPDNLHDALTEWRNLEEEIALLEAIEDGILDASEGVIRHRGQVVPKAELSELIQRVKRERDEVLSEIERHDRRCRSVHEAAAKEVGRGWDEYLHSLTALLHYAEHSENDLSDAQGHLANVTSMATATGRVNSAKLKRILVSANDLQTVMARLDRQADQLKLPEAVLKDLELESWREAFAKLELPPADEQNIGQWMEVVDSWSLPMLYSFGALRRAVLAELLKSESDVAALYLGEEEPRPAPQPAVVPKEYARRPRGGERARQKKLDWWSRFTLADGTGPAVLRFAAAAAIVAAVVLAGLFVGRAEVVIYNGLSTPVRVAIDEREVAVGPLQHETISMGTHLRDSTIVARTSDGREIESFQTGINRPFASYVYNVAGAAPMVEWIVTYGFEGDHEPELLGTPRWRTTKAQYIFTEPPRQIKTSNSGESRRVLESNAELPPPYLVQLIRNPHEREQVIRTHVLWDESDNQHFTFWLAMASEQDDFDELLARRLEFKPDDVATLRVEQETTDPERKAAVLQRHREQARQHPDDPGWQYLGIRAMPDGPEQDQAFLEALQKWPDNLWLANAVAYLHALNADWEAALALYDRVLKDKGPIYEGAALQAARIRRLTAGNQPPNLSDLQDAFQLSQMLSMESGTGLENSPYRAYGLMNRGKLEEAYQAAGGRQADPGLLVLLAASAGARQIWQQQALELPVDQIGNPDLLLYLIALAWRNDRPYDAYVAQYEESYRNRDSRATPWDYVQRFIADKQPPQTLEEDITGLDPKDRGLVLAAAVVMFPGQAQESWKQSARALLFAAERPAFNP